MLRYLRLMSPALREKPLNAKTEELEENRDNARLIRHTPTPRTSTSSQRLTSGHTETKDRKRTKKVAGKFVAIISSTETTSGGEEAEDSEKSSHRVRTTSIDRLRDDMDG